jgi:hypothetical protein
MKNAQQGVDNGFQSEMEPAGLVLAEEHALA